MNNNIHEIRSAVKKIAWGFFLIHIDFNLIVVDILPDWAGIILMVVALAFVVASEEIFRKLRGVGIFLAVWSIIAWIGSFFGINGYLSYVAFIPAICNMYFIYKLFFELSHIAERYNCPQRSSLRFWGITDVVLNLVSTVVSYVAIIFSAAEALFGVNLIILAVGLVFMLGSMITLFRFAGALKCVPDSSSSEIQASEEVNPFGDAAEL